MSVLSFATPAQAAITGALPFLRSAAVAARPLLGLGALVSLLMLFRPLVVGLFRAAVIAIVPRRSVEERKHRRTLSGVLLLNRMARELDTTQPNLAAEMRLLAARG